MVEQLTDMIAEKLIKIPRNKIAIIANDPVKTAAAVNLKYVSDTEKGIERIRSAKGFKYRFKNKTINDADDLQRIKTLVIPPAWENVWICRFSNGHLQVTGLDAKKRKQYRYHSLWNSLRNQTKFFRLYEFGKALSGIRLQLEKDLALSGLPMQKVMATVVSLMERTHIRIGNNFYEKLYGSFGLSTLKNKHVNISGVSLKFIFIGKKGVQHDITIKSKKLAEIVKQCRDIPGKELFQYYDDTGEVKSVDSGMINEYIKHVAGSDFTAKDFRTWAGTVHALLAFKKLGFYETATELKKKTAEALDIVSKELGNTRTVCKKYYVHPGIIDMYENKSLEKYIQQLNSIEIKNNKTGLTAEEEIVMKILKLQ